MLTLVCVHYSHLGVYSFPLMWPFSYLFVCTFLVVVVCLEGEGREHNGSLECLMVLDVDVNGKL